MVTTSAWLIVAGSLLCAGQTCALAQEWETPSVRSPSSHHHQHFIRPLLPYEEPQPLRIAVVGAGAAGTSSAYFLRFLSDQHLLPSVDISIFEKEDYIGGRSTTVQLPSESSHDSSGHIAEVGASIFVQANRHLQHAVKTFNLSLQSG